MESKFTFMQRIYIEAIEKYKKRHYEIPKVREIADLVGVKSRGTVGDMLRRLKEKGYDYKEETWMNENLDEVLEEFEDRIKNAKSRFRDEWEKDPEKDSMYNVDIHIWRETGMGNSLQTIVGNSASIFAATASYLETLVRKEVFTIKELEYMMEMVKDALQDK